MPLRFDAFPAKPSLGGLWIIDLLEGPMMPKDRLHDVFSKIPRYLLNHVSLHTQAFSANGITEPPSCFAVGVLFSLPSFENIGVFG